MDYFYQWDAIQAAYCVYKRQPIGDPLLLEIYDDPDEAKRIVDRYNDRAVDDDDEDDEFERVDPPPVGAIDYPAGTWGIFEDWDQAQTHIGHRLVTFNGIGRMVSRVLAPENPGDRGKVELKDPCAGMVIARGQPPVVDPEGPILVDIDDPGFDSFRFNPLGWCNMEDGATLMELKPIRQTRRGYGDENVGVYTFPDNHNGWIERPDNVFVNGLFREDGFAEMLAGSYPTYEDSVATLLQTEGAAVAISPLLCIQSDADGHVWLWRYGDRIGYVPDAITVRLGKRWRFLKEELQECGTIPNGVMIR